MRRAIPQFRLVPEPLTEEARALPGFKWASDEAGTRHRLGGTPEFLQKDEPPQCPDCKEQMTFYAQLDSINDEFCLADVGLLYVFVCFQCSTTASFIHSP